MCVEMSLHATQNPGHGCRGFSVTGQTPCLNESCATPSEQKVDVYRPTDTGATVDFLGLDDTLTGDEVLPGFSLKLSALFS